MVNINSADYRKEAIDYAVEELATRGVTPDQNPTEVSAVSAQIEPKHEGVRGWLLLFCLTLIIFNPLKFFNTLIETASLYSALLQPLFTVVIVEILVSVGLMCLGLYAGYALWTIKHNAVKIAKTYLLALLIFSAIDFLLLFNLLEALRVSMYMAGLAQDFNRIRREGIEETIGALIYVSLWYTYLNNSKRVKATYTENAKPPARSEFSTLNLNR